MKGILEICQLTYSSWKPVAHNLLFPSKNILPLNYIYLIYLSTSSQLIYHFHLSFIYRSCYNTSHGMLMRSSSFLGLLISYSRVLYIFFMSQRTSLSSCRHYSQEHSPHTTLTSCNVHSRFFTVLVLSTHYILSSLPYNAHPLFPAHNIYVLKD